MQNGVSGKWAAWVKSTVNGTSPQCPQIVPNPQRVNMAGAEGGIDRLRMLRLWTSVLVLSVCLAVAFGGQGETPVKRTPVEFWHVGDDGLSERLADAVDKAFERSSDFTPSSGKKPGTLVVYIPENVDWTKKLGRTKVLYHVEFKSIDGPEFRDEIRIMLGKRTSEVRLADCQRCEDRGA
jgi:hypothetical protein